LWGGGVNPGMLSTPGSFYGGEQQDLGYRGRWWASTRSNDDTRSNYLFFNSFSALLYDIGKYSGFSVRCLSGN